MRYKRAYFYSCLLHLIGVGCLVISFHYRSVTVGEPAVVHARLYQNLVVKHAARYAHSIHAPLHSFLSVTTNKKNKKIFSNLNYPALSHTQYAQDTQKSKGAPSPLLELLHDQVQSHIEYVVGAAHNTLTVIVQFSLFPSGYVGSIEIVQSSGNVSFDQVVLHALRAIQPVMEAKKYLRAETNFQLEIIFR